MKQIEIQLEPEKKKKIIRQLTPEFGVAGEFPHYNLIHIPTGWRVGAMFRTLKEAACVVAELAEFGDWSFTDITEFGKRIDVPALGKRLTPHRVHWSKHGTRDS